MGSNINIPEIDIKNIEEADFTIETHVTKDGTVCERRETTTVSDVEIGSLRDEIDSRIDEALEEFEETGEVEGLDLDYDPTDVSVPVSPDSEGSEDDSEADESEDEGDSDSGSGNESLDQIAEEATQRERLEDPEQIGRDVVAEHDITKSDWPSFAKHMREEGVEEDGISDVWHALRDEGVINGGSSGGGGSDASGGGSGDGAEDGSDGGAGGGADVDEAVDEEDVVAIPPETDIVIIKGEMTDAWLALAEELSEPIRTNKVVPYPVDSDVGRMLVEPMQGDVKTPLYVRVGSESFEVRELKDLIEKYA